ncbi:mitochondrial inheritance component MDM10 [Apiospora arundinis]|uniref:Mitochondrial distribution and morphology protein 10 n=1 Tax=Apiospora arundinis TaxID=335852 RepID=A0ABR2HLN1_9PEZI
MREFMDYIQSAFYTATGWNRDNSYSSLNATANGLLEFPTPRGVRLALGSLATPQFATAYQLGTVGVVDGSVSYLYSTVPLNDTIAQSARIPLPDLLKGYKPLQELKTTPTTVNNNNNKPVGDRSSDGDNGGAAAEGDALLLRQHQRRKEALAYGRLYLPRSMLEALVVKRFTNALQLQISAVSDQTLRNGGTVLGMVQYDKGRYGIEGLASSDGGLMGVRGLYNFGGDAEKFKQQGQEDGTNTTILSTGNGNGNGNGNGDRIYGRFSAGAELYYGTLNKSGGMSLGLRFATLPSHKGTPLTATMTINPLMGNMSWSYAVMAGQHCSLATRMDFNVYSYESDWVLGMELWRKKGSWTINRDNGMTDATATAATTNDIAMEQAFASRFERSFEAKMDWRMDDPALAAATALGTATPNTATLGTSTPAELVSPPSANEVEAEPTKNMTVAPAERSFQAKLEWRLDDRNEKKKKSSPQPSQQQPPPQKAEAESDEPEYPGVLKVRLDQHMKLGLVWEGRIKSLLFSLGSGVDLRKLDSPFRSLGLEVQFTS